MLSRLLQQLGRIVTSAPPVVSEGMLVIHTSSPSTILRLDYSGHGRTSEFRDRHTQNGRRVLIPEIWILPVNRIKAIITSRSIPVANDRFTQSRHSSIHQSYYTQRTYSQSRTGTISVCECSGLWSTRFTLLPFPTTSICRLLLSSRCPRNMIQP